MVTPDHAPEEVDVMADRWATRDGRVVVTVPDEEYVTEFGTEALAEHVVARHNEWLESEAFKAKLWGEEGSGCTCLEVFNQHAVTCSKATLLVREEAP